MIQAHKLIAGQRFSRLEVLSRAPSDRAGNSRWLCRCDCGVEKVILGGSLRSGATSSCGCFNRDRDRPVIHGASGTASYNNWASMVQRCTNPNNPRWGRYGGRGIKVCERWLTYPNFLADMGPRPVGKTLDRYPDNDGNYEPSNCRWATRVEQQNNTSKNRRVLVGGEFVTCAEAARIAGIPSTTFRSRLKRGWDAQRAATTPTSSGQAEAVAA